jgi:hypothetical protein
MKRSLWIVCALLMLSASFVLTVIAIPFGNSFCPTENSGGENFAGFIFMIFAGAITLVLGSIVATVMLRKYWRRNLKSSFALSKLAIVMLAFPLVWAALSLAYHSDTCVGFGRTLTPEQLENIRHG